MNVNFVKRALGFHGPPLQMIWEEEQGSGQLQKLGVGQQVDYSIYHERQKSFTFQDRAKRLKLHQFFARKANDLYDRELNISTGVLDEEHLRKAKPLFATTPPYECFVNLKQDRVKRLHAILEGIEPGDIIYGIITKVSFQSTTSPFMIKPLCTEEPLVRYLNDIPVKAYINFNNVGTLPLDAQGTPRRYAVNDYVCCAVLETSIDAERLYLSMETGFVKNKQIKLGLITYENLPKYYKKAVSYTTENYNQCLRESKEFLNPNYDILFSINGLNTKDHFSMMNSLKYPFPREDYAKSLRQTQASQWAVRSVVEGITLFRDGHHMEAFQALNKALNIDPRNVEGLVARGALYANKSSFLKAIEDFEAALKLAPHHTNARTYICETLVALGRNYEEKQKYPDAINAYKDCLKWIPNHEQALSSLIAIQTQKNCQPYLHLLPELGAVAPLVPVVPVAPIITRDVQMPSTSKDAAQPPITNVNNFIVDDGSMSPLSKRMALHVATMKASEKTKAPYDQPFYMNNNFGMTADHTQSNVNMHSQLNNILLDDDDDETLSQVRKLLQKASKHKNKDKDKEKEKYKSSSSSKKKKHRKSKSDSPMEKDKRKKSKDIVDAKQIDKTTADLNRELAKYEKNIAKIVKRQDVLKASMAKHSMSSRSPSPVPPPPPSMRLPEIAVNTKEREPKLSFQIRRPVKVDKFGLVRIATPLTQSSPTATPERSRSRSRDRKRSRSRYTSRRRSRSRRRRSSSRSRSSSYGRRHRYSRSRSRSRGRVIRRYKRSRSSSLGYSRRNGYRRRSPSPFVPRGTPSPKRRGRSRHNRSTSTNGNRGKFGNLVWQREDYKATTHANASSNNMDDPSIEEIDEMITKAQKERKQEIINRDKSILKKSQANA